MYYWWQARCVVVISLPAVIPTTKCIGGNTGLCLHHLSISEPQTRTISDRVHSAVLISLVNLLILWRVLEFYTNRLSWKSKLGMYFEICAIHKLHFQSKVWHNSHVGFYPVALPFFGTNELSNTYFDTYLACYCAEQFVKWSIRRPSVRKKRLNNC